MKLEEWFDFFKCYKSQKIFHFHHLKLLTGLNGHNLRVSLNRLAGRKVIQRISRGFYANPFNPPTVEEISAEIYSPSYISLESALHRWGLLSQVPYNLTCVTTRYPRKFSTPFGVVEYRQIKKNLFLGFVKEKSYFLAKSEKAFVDFLYLNRRREIRGFVAQLDLKLLNKKMLHSFAKKAGVLSQCPV